MTQSTVHDNAFYLVGRKLMKDGELGQVNEVEAFHLIESAAEDELPRAQNETGENYFEGFGVDRNDSLAFYWFNKAARQGYSFAQFNMAVAYTRGIGVVPNPEQKLKWLLVSHRVKPSENKLAYINELKLALSGKTINRATEQAENCIETNYREC